MYRNRLTDSGHLRHLRSGMCVTRTRVRSGMVTAGTCKAFQIDIWYRNIRFECELHFSIVNFIILNKHCCRQKVVQARCRGAKKQFLSRMSTNRLLRRWQRLIRIGAEIIYLIFNIVFCHSFSVSSINLNLKRLKEWNCNRSGIISQVDMILYSWKLIQYDHFEFIQFTI